MPEIDRGTRRSLWTGAKAPGVLDQNLGQIEVSCPKAGTLKLHGAKGTKVVEGAEII